MMNPTGGATFRFRDSPVRTKMMLVFGPLIVLPLVLTGVAIGVITTSSTIEKGVSSGLDGTRIVADRMDETLRSAEMCSNMLVIGLNQLHESLFGNGRTPSEIAVNNAFHLELSATQNFFPMVQQIFFVTPTGLVYASTVSPKDTHGSVLTGDWTSLPVMATAAQSIGKSLWIPLSLRDYLVSDPVVPVITVVKRLLSLQTGDTLGFMVLNLHASTLGDAWSQGTTKLEGHEFTLADESGTVWLSSGEGRSPLVQETKLDWGLGKVFLTVPLAHMGLRLQNSLSLDGLKRDLLSIFLLLVGVAGVALAASLVAAQTLTGFLTRPIVLLRNAMADFASVGIPSPTPLVLHNDEIGQIAQSFNAMAIQIEKLIQEIGREHHEKAGIQLALFQAQIQPHFLYNTLDTVYALSRMGRHEQAQTAAKSLADYYRFALSGGREVITLGEELRGIHAYLGIQHIRYPEVFEWSADVPESLQSWFLPKLTLQPLVENSIDHGLRQKEGGGRISISAKEQEGGLVIEVSDTGVGISEERLREIESKEETPSPGAWALGNIRQRLLLFYGEASRLQIRSAEGLGTTVQITLPLSAPESLR